jgi:hypothetical protein
MPNPLILPLVLATGAGIVGGVAYLRKKRKGKQLPKPITNGGAIGDGGGEETVHPDDADAAQDAAAIVGPLVVANSVASFHPPSKGDNLSAVSRRSLRAIYPDVTDQQVAAMRKALATSEYNRQLYGEPVAASYFHPDGVSVDKVFTNKHEGVELLRAGFVPRRNIDASGQRTGTAQNRGALWVPDVNVAALKEGVHDFAILFSTAWPDDSSGLEPPPTFWDAAVVRA